MEKIIYSVLLFLTAAAFLVTLIGCANVGTGQSSLIRAKTNNTDYLRLFPQYTTNNDNEQLIPLTKNASTDYEKFTKLLIDRYGSSSFVPADLAVTIRDRGKLPPFLPVDIQLPSKLYDLYSGSEKATAQDKIKLEKLLIARLYNVQDLIPRTTVHHHEGVSEVFYYYPRLSLDFSSQLTTQVVDDRFSYLAIALVLQEQPRNNRGDVVRFIDFWPKGADIVEYSRGNLKQEAQLSAKGTAARSGENIKGTKETQEAGDSSLSNSANKSSGIELSYMFTETYVNELKDAFEQRTGGLFDNGRTFLAGFRSIKNKRIGGTYNFDLMLEVPSELNSDLTSKPITNNIVAKAYLVAVVRHVYESGKTGIINRVPEPDNDKVYEQVILKEIDPLTIWSYGELPYESEKPADEFKFELNVYTNIEDARFIVRDIDENKVIGIGHGKEATILLPIEKSRDINARVEFLDAIILSGGKGHITIVPPKNVEFVIPKNEVGVFQTVGEYKLNQ